MKDIETLYSTSFFVSFFMSYTRYKNVTIAKDPKYIVSCNPIENAQILIKLYYKLTILNMSNVDQITWLNIIFNVLSTTKLIALTGATTFFALCTAGSLVVLFNSSKHHLLNDTEWLEKQRNSETLQQTRRRKIINKVLAQPETGSTTEGKSIDIFTNNLVQIEGNKDLSIVATISSFGKYDKVEPTSILKAANIEIFRSAFVDGFDINSTNTFEHKLISIKPKTNPNKSAVLILMLRHSDAFHSSSYENTIEDLENIRKVFSTFQGANIKVGIYIATEETPKFKNFVKDKNSFLFSPEDIEQLPVSILQSRIIKHTHVEHSKQDKFKPHIKYIFNQSKKLKKYHDKYVAVLIPKGSKFDHELKRDQGFSNFVQIYNPFINSESPTSKEEFERYGLSQFANGLTRARNTGEVSPDLRAWAGQYAAGFQAKYKLQWEAGDFDTSKIGRFFIHINYRHFDIADIHTLSVLYEPPD